MWVFVCVMYVSVLHSASETIFACYSGCVAMSWAGDVYSQTESASGTNLYIIASVQYGRKWILRAPFLKVPRLHGLRMFIG